MYFADPSGNLLVSARSGSQNVHMACGRFRLLLGGLGVGLGQIWFGDVDWQSVEGGTEGLVKGWLGGVH